MRIMISIGLTAALAACSAGSDKKEAKADAVAAASGFKPPSVMSRVDYGLMIDRRFRALDRNGDDQLTGDELPRADSRLMALDRDRDGAITQHEFSTGLLARFDKRDINDDGTVTSYENRKAGTKPR